MISRSLQISLKKYRINPIVRALILSDVLYWGASGLLAPIFSIFIADRLGGGSLQAAGLAATLYLLTRSLAEIPIGMLIDKIKGDRDDLFFLVTGGILQGVLYVSLIFIENVNQLYIVQILFGLTSAFSTPSWYSIFTKHIDKNEEGFEWGLDDVLISVSMAITAVIGGYIAQKYSFDLVFMIVGILTILSAMMPLLIKRYLKGPA